MYITKEEQLQLYVQNEILRVVKSRLSCRVWGWTLMALARKKKRTMFGLIDMVLKATVAFAITDPEL